jgi:hypothetical protein
VPDYADKPEAGSPPPAVKKAGKGKK